MSYSNRANIHGYCSSSIHYFNNFYFHSFFLSLLQLHNQRPHHLLLPLIHTLPQTKSKINHKNQKSTTKSTTKSPIDTTKPNTPTHGHTNRDREEWISACGGSVCLDWRSSHRAWIGVPLAVLGSAFFSSCLDQSSSRRAWIGVLDRRRAWIEVSDRRRAWTRVSDGNFRSAFEFQMEISTWIGVSDRHRAPCLDRNFREFGIERSFREE